MSVVRRHLAAAPDAVFDVLADGWSLGLWVVGAVHIRDVDPDWPAVGAQVHHSVGCWPLLLADRTEVEELVPGRRLQLRAHAHLAGSARVLVTLQPEGDGTRVRMAEDAVDGPGALVPGPIRSLVLDQRNIEALSRLEALAIGRVGDRGTGVRTGGGPSAQR